MKEEASQKLIEQLKAEKERLLQALEQRKQPKKDDKEVINLQYQGNRL